MKTLAVLAVALALSVPGSGFQVPGSGFQVRFHHVHYEVADPSAAMADAVATFGGTRQIVQGLGVGVKTGDIFLLFDRGGAESATPPLADAYNAGLAWLAARGITADPADVSRFPSGHHHLAFATSE